MIDISKEKQISYICIRIPYNIPILQNVKVFPLQKRTIQKNISNKIKNNFPELRISHHGKIIKKSHIMEDQLVTFKTAKLAKEKEFIHVTENFYDGGGNVNKLDFNYANIREYKSKEKIKCINPPFNWNSLNTESKLLQFEWKNQIIQEHFTIECSAPTQTLLQLILRKRHDIIVLVSDFKKEGNGNKMYSYSINYKKSDSWFSSYEKALEEGLQEALKLIE